MDLCGRGTALGGGLTSGFYLQHHLHAVWEDELIKEASGVGRVVEPEFPQGGETDPSTGRRGGCLRRVKEGNLDEFEQRTSFEEGY